MDESQLEAVIARIDIWLLVFGIVVVIGVAGESFFGIRHWWNSRKLQVFQQDRITRLTREIVEANARVAAAELETAKIREKMADRHLSEEQRKSIAAKLPNLSDVTVSVMRLTEAAEATVFAKEIEAVFALVGKEVPNGKLSSSEIALRGIAVTIFPDASRETTEAANAIAGAFLSERVAMANGGITVVPGLSGMFAGQGEAMQAAIRIFIGDKP